MGTRHTGSAKEVLALNTFIKLSRASESIDARLARAATLEELTITQFAVMEALYHLGSLTQTELGAKLLKSGGNITLVIDNLQRHGFVERRRCTEDRRLSYVDLTESGREKIARIFPRQVKAITQLMSALTEEEQEQLGYLLRKLGTGRTEASEPEMTKRQESSSGESEHETIVEHTLSNPIREDRAAGVSTRDAVAA